LNSLPYFDQENNLTHTLYFFKSMINHSTKSNLDIQYMAPHLAFMYAAEDIEAGTELVVDYCSNIHNVTE
jgi:hypothetical protein